MSAPSFMAGTGFALAASIVGAGTSLLAAPIVGAADALRLVVVAIGFTYVAWLLHRARLRTGRLSMAALWTVVTGLVLALDPPLIFHAAAQLALVWLARAVFHHGRVLLAIADLGIGFASLAAAAWAAERTGSLALTLWCLLLVQAASALLPSGAEDHRAARDGALDEEDPFEHAHHNADAAVRRLLSTR